MEVAVGKGFHILAHSDSSPFVRKSVNGISNTNWLLNKSNGGSSLHHHHRTVARAKNRPTWLPGLDPPPYLYGNLKWYVQADLVHARFAMAGVAGILFTDLLRVTGISGLPVWYEAGATKYFASSRTLLFSFVETNRYMNLKSPGSQAKEGSFFCLEAALEGLEPGYPGGPLLNPLGLAKDIKNAHEWKLKEIKNGRLAMVALFGIFVQANAHMLALLTIS